MRHGSRKQNGQPAAPRPLPIDPSWEAVHRGRDELGEQALKVFELSQALQERWLTADCAAKRHILDLLCSNFTLDGASLVCETRKPFDVLAEGLEVSSSRGDRI
ncbi:MAG: hypothetical protein WBD40_06910 [Tepidisphaeraceae bacterium]